MSQFIIIGDITVDDVVLPDGTTRFQTPGGGSIYAAGGAKVWSEAAGSIAVVSRVGPEYPEQNLDRWRQAGLDVRGVTRVELPTIRVWILYEGRTKRQIVFRLDSGRSPALDPQPADVPAEYLRAQFAHIAPMAASSQIAIANLLTAHRIPFSLDLALVGSEVNPHEFVGDGGLQTCELFLPSIQEFETVWGSPPTATLLEKVAQAGPKVIAVKQGNEGSIVYDARAGAGFRVPIVPVEVVDTTGAGDAYCGGFMVGYCLTGNALEAALMGTVSASFAVESFGAWHGLQAEIAEARRRLAALRPCVEGLV